MIECGMLVILLLPCLAAPVAVYKRQPVRAITWIGWELFLVSPGRSKGLAFNLR